MTNDCADSARPLAGARAARRLAVWFWNEPSFLVRFWSALALLAPVAVLVWWLA